MSRREDLESYIRESYGIIREYEDMIRTSDRPDEKLRAQRAIDGQWALIEGYVGEYQRLAGGAWPRDIVEIAARFQPGGAPGAVPASPGGQAATVFDQRGQHVGQQINVAGDYRAGGPGTGGAAGGPGAASGGTGGGWSSETIRRLLLDAFSDQELTTLCFDHFHEVYEDLSAGMGKGEKVQRLLEHCLRYRQVDRLLDLVRERNPAQYERFERHREG